jgi:hypothetical protein
MHFAIAISNEGFRVYCAIYQHFFYVIKFWIFRVVFESIEEKIDKKLFEFGLG